MNTNVISQTNSATLNSTINNNVSNSGIYSSSSMTNNGPTSTQSNSADQNLSILDGIGLGITNPLISVTPNIT